MKRGSEPRRGEPNGEEDNLGWVDGFHTAVLVGAATTLAGLVAVLAFLPSRPSEADVELLEAALTRFVDVRQELVQRS